jgi:glycosyltransferase involved in cell wall biosynthesis
MDVAKSGAWQVTRNIILNLKEQDKLNEYVIYTEKTYADDFGPLPHNFRTVRSSITARQPFLNILWHAFILPFLLIRDRADVLYLPWHAAALVIKTRPVVLTIHDLTEYKLPRHYSRLRMLYRKLMIPLSSRLADRIVAVSHYTKADIVKFLHVPAAKVEVVYNAVTDGHFDQVNEAPSADPGRDMAALRSKYGIESPYLLYVGQIQHPNKNLLQLVRAFNVLKAECRLPHRLVIAGKAHISAGPIFQEVLDLGLKGDVVFPGYIPDADLPGLYRSADVFIYMSLFEGFGIPPLEAMYHGCPVITSNTTSLPEVVGDAGVLVDPSDLRVLVNAVKKVLNDPERRADMVRKGKLRAASFSWKDSAAKMRAIFESLHHRKA